MAVFYVGHRPVLRGRSTTGNVHPYKGAGVYSNWSIFNDSQILEGAPNEDHVPGTGRHPHDLQMSRRWRGLDTEAPLDAPGLGPELEWHRNFKDLYALKGEGAQDVFKSGYGHQDRETSYSLWEPWSFKGHGTAPLNDPGHGIRDFGDEGTANDFGRRNPWLYHGVNDTPLADAGDPIADKPTGLDHAFQEINVWKGVPAAKALDV
jgi:hypothetical protein